MSKRTRDFLFYFFIVAFIVMTVLVSLYASGYKFNLSWPLKFNRLLQKTGMLIVSTLPKEANIYLNDKQQKNSLFRIFKNDYITTPAKLKNILPGEYTLKLERENYWTFEKKIRIDSGQTTFVEDINLFRSDLPMLVVSNESSNPVLSDNGRYLYLPSQGRIINLKDSTILPTVISPEKKGRWLKDSSRLFVDGKIIDPDKNAEIDLVAMTGLKKADWYYSDYDDLVYYSDGQSLNKLQYDNRTISTLIKGEEYLSFEPRGDNIFAIVKTDSKIYLKNYQTKNAQKVAEMELPTVGDYKFKQENNQYLSIYDQRNLTLYLVNSSDLNDSYIIKNIKSWAWINSDEIIYNNDWEINVFNLKSGRGSLVTRVSEMINNIIWHKEGRYYIYSTKAGIYAADLITGTTVRLFESSDPGSPILDEKNDLLYFIAEINNIQGVYKLLLQ